MRCTDFSTDFIPLHPPNFSAMINILHLKPYTGGYGTEAKINKKKKKKKKKKEKKRKKKNVKCYSLSPLTYVVTCVASNLDISARDVLIFIPYCLL